MLSSQAKDEWKGMKELSWMAVPGMAGMGLFVLGLKFFEWAGGFCIAGAALIAAAALLLALSLYIYWRTDFRGNGKERKFVGFLVSTAGTALLVVLAVRFLG